ncbi:glycosyltransferase family 4 protein [Prevotella sp. 10(H)]|uniref:glycosyltransferase family 4 protein n=1 Tax=Prevotella sp. 10(H) TaxID=1158294 RepID=UPI0004A6FB0B|nr:glycosyltransferase family 4 protein [Prevotella sp. 10(H)]
MKKIAVVISRYGKEINGGAELHARNVAEHLNEKYDVTVLTSCENDDSQTQGVYYLKGNDKINDVKILRFESQQKDKTNENKTFRYLHKNSIFRRERFSLPNFIKLAVKKIKYRSKKNFDRIFEDWIETQGAYTPDLITYIKKNQNNYDTFIFFLYYHYTTYTGINEVANKSILVPIAHDDPALCLISFDKVFASARFIMYNSLSEKEWVEKLHPVAKNAISDIVGVGCERPRISLASEEQPKINFPYFVYIGRIHESKGCSTMFEYFKYYKQQYNNDIKLVLIGKNFMGQVDNSEDIIYTGFISEQKKYHYLQNAIALIIPSPYESLSIVTLEAMAMGKPVLANGHCDILKKHIELSHAGYFYYNKKEFCEALYKLATLNEKEKEAMAQNGISYVEGNYDWKVVIGKYIKVIENIGKS